MLKKIRGYIVVLVVILLIHLIYNLIRIGVLPPDYYISLNMLAITLVTLIIGAMFKALNKIKAASFIGHADFIALCILLYYSHHLLDLIIFVATIVLLAHIAIDLREVYLHEDERQNV